MSYPSGRKNVGTYTVKVTFKGNYIGSKSATFAIKPKGTSVSKVTAAKKGFKVTWKKQATQTTGYEVQYSTASNFKKGNKTVTVSKNKTTSKVCQQAVRQEKVLCAGAHLQDRESERQKCKTLFRVEQGEERDHQEISFVSVFQYP